MLILHLQEIPDVHTANLPIQVGMCCLDKTGMVTLDVMVRHGACQPAQKERELLLQGVWVSSKGTSALFLIMVLSILEGSQPFH